MSGNQERTRYYSTRPRRIPPEFCTDEQLEECSELAALLLYRIISQADDQGRLPGHAKYLKAVCFAMRTTATERKVGGALDELVRAGFLIRYDVAGRTYLQVDRWTDLQGKWGRRAYPSRYPAPAGWDGDWVSKAEATDASEVRAPSEQPARTLHAPVPLPSAIPSSPPFSGLGSPAARGGRPQRVGDLLGRATKGRMSEEDAFELGSALATGTTDRATDR